MYDELTRLLEQDEGTWSVVVRDAVSGAVLLDHGGDRIMRTASVGKLILLAFVGSELAERPVLAHLQLDRRQLAPVSDSGIWQYLDIDTLSVAELARLIFLASDNLATNVLLDHFGLARVRAFRAGQGLKHTDLLDIVRDQRRDNDPETLSRGTAGELCAMMSRIGRGELVNAEVSQWLYDGLSLNMDLSMVPCPFGLDPLVRHDEQRDGKPAVANKTGTDPGVRADVGIVQTGTSRTAYAAICNYPPGPAADKAALRLMCSIGRAILDRDDSIPPRR